MVREPPPERRTMAAPTPGGDARAMGRRRGRPKTMSSVCRSEIGRCEAPAQRQVQIDTLREALALHLQQQRSSAVQRELSLLDRSQIDLADVELNLRELERPLVVDDVLGEDGLAITQRD